MSLNTGIILPERIILAILKQYLSNAATIDSIPDMFYPGMFSNTDLTNILNYFKNKKVHILPGYPIKQEISPAIYIAAGDISDPDNDMFPESLIKLAQDKLTGSKYDGEISVKTTRIIAVANDPVTCVALASIANYILRQYRSTLHSYGMDNARFTYQEIDLVQRFFPQELFYRSFTLRLDVIDTFLALDGSTIQKIDIDCSTAFDFTISIEG